VPNPESALNEEAGKLLLESHDEYSERAKMMTEIHAQVILLNSSLFFLILLCIVFYIILIYNFFREVEKAVRLV